MDSNFRLSNGVDNDFRKKYDTLINSVCEKYDIDITLVRIFIAGCNNIIIAYKSTIITEDETSLISYIMKYINDFYSTLILDIGDRENDIETLTEIFVGVLKFWEEYLNKKEGKK